MPEPAPFHDQTALVDRLSTGIKKRNQEVVFIIGAPISAPIKENAPGVPGVEGMIALAREEFASDVYDLRAFDDHLLSNVGREYQAAFTFLHGRRGQQTINDVVRTAVLRSTRRSGDIEAYLTDVSEESCRRLEENSLAWTLGPGIEALGRLAAEQPSRFGRTILTTNFDPLIQVAIRRSGGESYRTVLPTDGSLTQTEARGTHCVYLHGYWRGSDTLHTPPQLTQPRPRLKSSLSTLVRNSLVVVCAYSGWDDVFAEALMGVVSDESAYPDVLWTFYAKQPDIAPALANRLRDGIGRGRVTLYSGIDCNTFLPALLQRWATGEQSSSIANILAQSNPVILSPATIADLESKSAASTVIEGDDEDRPPEVSVCVGRDGELHRLSESKARVGFITGVGGQGKSTLAAKYFEEAQQNKAFLIFVWRDCKEESERFENQLISVIEKLTDGRSSGAVLAKQSSEAIISILIDLLKSKSILFVFDNADHYVDLESGILSGSAGIFVDRFLNAEHTCQTIFTCRTSISYEDATVFNCPLVGLKQRDAVELFQRRGAKADRRDINDAHELTDGHAFWLDLFAIQVAKPEAAVNLSDLLREVRASRGLIPETTLASIWNTLKDRERIVLRAMAETVRPETEEEIGEYLRKILTFQKVLRAFKALRALNLVVIKRRGDGSEILELHPMVREFVRHHFSISERSAYILAIINVYQRFITGRKAELAERPALSTLQRWTGYAELDIAARRFADAFKALAEVAEPLSSSGYPREFTRVARLLLHAVDWVKEHESFECFESVFRSHAENLLYLGHNREVDEILDAYATTVPDKNVRYIRYCELRCYSKWFRNEFADAVRWGETGYELKKNSKVDTEIDIEHTLALAQRDAGKPDVALSTFLKGFKLAEIVNADEFHEERGGPLYGNVGRCLQFMGQMESALVCFQKSAILIEKNPRFQQMLNQGYIRCWIGEVLAARQQYGLASVFLRAALLKWQQVSPARATGVSRFLKQIRPNLSSADTIPDSQVEQVCRDWILGRRVDNRYFQASSKT